MKDEPLPLWPADLPADELRYIYDTEGVVALEGVFDAEEVAVLRPAIMAAIESDVQVFGGAEDNPRYGSVVSLLHYVGALPELLKPLCNQRYTWPIEELLDSQSILYTYTNVCTPPNSSTFALPIHRDQQFLVPCYRLRIAAMVLLDDFTLENGATYFLVGSQHQDTPPDEGLFYANARRLIAPKGSVCYFDPCIWHAAGPNTTDSWRHMLVSAFSRPWMKQRLDIPRLLTARGFDPTDQPEALLRRLGYLHQVPESYEEYKMPIPQRIENYAQAARAAGTKRM